jgi:hypothetical protein
MAAIAPGSIQLSGRTMKNGLIQQRLAIACCSARWNRVFAVRSSQASSVMTSETRPET